MSRTQRRRRTLVTLTVTAALACTGAAASANTPASDHAPQTGQSRPLAGLRVLLTNDDSMRAATTSNADGLGLYEIRKALCDAGADVVVIAPWQVQSGRGTAVTNGGTLSLSHRAQLPAGYENDCSGTPSGSPVYGVCLATGPCGPDSPSATPTDTVKFALRAGLAAKAGWRSGPDLVVAGINSGPNVSAQVNDSGTVGAALAAIHEGVPAVAFSSSGDATQRHFPVANYRAHARFAAGFLGGLRERGLFTDRFALKVDYPDVSAGQKAKPPVWTSVGHGKVVWHAYEPRTPGEPGGDLFDITLGICDNKPTSDCTETVKDADSTAMLGRGHIAVAPVTADRTYGARTSGAGQRDLAHLKWYVERHAPRS
ncbi:5'/3'-nucleotidase SurE [Streptomyces sp. TRM64462]|uniref:5'/3'-nucleotidase SurE n=1 Tax=Streptomyces sp. TRM64462 TaxID=2741726 RepID=UPI001586D025|nr:5'/3'-nucleotidase SurE [Streptomyces sp. TRM64462]